MLRNRCAQILAMGMATSICLATTALAEEPLSISAKTDGSAAAQTTAPAPAAEFKPFAADQALADLPARWSGVMDLFNVPGAAVAVVRDGMVYMETFGVRDTASGAPVTPDTMFYIASITKTYNATAVGTLVEQGRLSLDDKVIDHLPQLALPEPGLAEKLTIRDLLDHRYGLRSGPAVMLDAFTGEITDERYFYWLARGESAGTLAYSNIHYTLLGRVIEKITGMDWRDYLREAVLAPAGLDRTTGYASVMYGDDNAATPTSRDADGTWHAEEQRKTDRTMHAAGGLGTTARDAMRYLALHLGDGELDGTRIVSTEYAQSMRQVQARHEEPEGSIRIMEGFGLGWQVGTYVGEAPLCVHGGGYAGAGAWFALLPEQKTGIAILINAGGLAQGWGDVVAIDLLERLTGKEPPWRPFDRYPERARQVKEERRQEAAAADPAQEKLLAAHLSRPMGEYTGWYHHPQLGTLIIEFQDGGLAIRLGDAPLEAAPGEAADNFTLGGQFDPPAACRFVITPGGEIDEVHLTDESLGDFIFKR